MKLMSGLLVGFAIAGSSGCYRYVPSTIEAVSEGDRVHAVLDEPAQRRLREQHNLETTRLSGTLVQREGQKLSFYVPSGPMSQNFGTPQTLYQLVEVNESDIVRVDLREMDVFRTVTLAAVGAAAATFIVVRSLRGGEPATPNGGGDGPPESVRGWLIQIPLIRW